jgi:hypothetical protein
MQITHANRPCNRTLQVLNVLRETQLCVSTKASFAAMSFLFFSAKLVITPNDRPFYNLIFPFNISQNFPFGLKAAFCPWKFIGGLQI